MRWALTTLLLLAILLIVLLLIACARRPLGDPVGRLVRARAVWRAESAGARLQRRQDRRRQQLSEGSALDWHDLRTEDPARVASRLTALASAEDEHPPAACAWRAAVVDGPGGVWRIIGRTGQSTEASQPPSCGPIPGAGPNPPG